MGWFPMFGDMRGSVVPLTQAAQKLVGPGSGRTSQRREAGWPALGKGETPELLQKRVGL
jgi:hypothetical protein